MNRNILIKLDKTVFQLIFYITVLISKLRDDREEHLYSKQSGVKKILVIRPGGLGDGLMSIPLLKALRNNLPDAHITLLCVKKNRAALQHLDSFDELLELDDFHSIRKNMNTLFLNKYDVVFDLEPFRKISSIITYFAGSDTRIGFDTNNRRHLYTHHVSYANDKCYESLNMVRQLSVMGIDTPVIEAVDMSFPLSGDIQGKALNVLAQYEINIENEFVVAVAPGVLKAHHRWKMPEFASLISMILKEDKNTKVLLMGSPFDAADGLEVMRCLADNDRVINLIGETDYMVSMGIFQNCRILIACDGGIVYMAAAMGCSTISIWGPGVMERFKPPGDNHIGLRKEYFCVPCVNYSRLGEFPECLYDRRCINDLTGEDVFNSYTELKKRISSGKFTRNPHEVPV